MMNYLIFKKNKVIKIGLPDILLRSLMLFDDKIFDGIFLISGFANFHFFGIFHKLINFGF